MASLEDLKATRRGKAARKDLLEVAVEVEVESQKSLLKRTLYAASAFRFRRARL